MKPISSFLLRMSALRAVPRWPKTFPPAPRLRRYAWSAFSILSGDPVSALGLVYAVFSALVVLLSVASQLVGTLPWYRVPTYDVERTGSPIYAVEIFVVICFTSEYVGRMMTAWSVPDRLELKWWGGRWPQGAPPFRLDTRAVILRELRHALKPMSILDVVAIVPFYAEVVEKATGSVGPLSLLRVLRLTRIFFLLKIARHSVGLRLLRATLEASAEVLGVLLLLLSFALVLLSSLVFVAEQGSWQPAGPIGPAGFYRPDALGNGLEQSCFTSIPASFWFTLTTLSTVAYGDCVPTTPWGKACAALTILISMVMVSLPITVLSSNFSIAYAAFLEARNTHARALLLLQRGAGAGGGRAPAPRHGAAAGATGAPAHDAAHGLQLSHCRAQALDPPNPCGGAGVGIGTDAGAGAPSGSGAATALRSGGGGGAASKITTGLAPADTGRDPSSAERVVGTRPRGAPPGVVGPAGVTGAAMVAAPESWRGATPSPPAALLSPSVASLMHRDAWSSANLSEIEKQDSDDDAIIRACAGLAAGRPPARHHACMHTHPSRQALPPLLRCNVCSPLDTSHSTPPIVSTCPPAVTNVHRRTEHRCRGARA